jgi:hypothetical protein
LYLFSAFFMLLGCYVLTVALNPTPLRLDKLLLVLGVLNIYEFILIGLGLFLVVQRGHLRDGRMLLVLGLMFAVDATYLNAQCVAANPSTGAMLSAGMLILGLAKVGLIMKFLGLRYSFGALSVVFAQLVVLFAAPGVFAWLLINRYADDGMLPFSSLYIAWWVVGIFLALLPLGRMYGKDESHVLIYSLRDTLGRLLVYIPFASLVVHLLLANGLYDRTFYVCNLSPMLLGLAVCVMRLDLREDNSLTIRWTPLCLVLAAIALSWVVPDVLIGSLGDGKLMLSPFRATLVGAAVTYGVFIWYYRLWGFGAASAVLALASLAGHTPRAIYLSIVTILKRGVRLVPSTYLAWGILAVTAAFVLLAAGACVSLLLWHGHNGDRNTARIAGG